MRGFYIVAFLALVGAVFLGMQANDTWEETGRVKARNDAMRADLKALADEVGTMEKLEPSPLRFADDALDEFFTRTVEAGEVLGAGVRIEPQGMSTRSLVFVEFRQGVRRCPVTLRAGLEASGAAPILAMFEEELADLPVAVRKVSARSINDVVTISMDVDVFGR